MYTGLLHTHSTLRYLVLIFLVIVIIQSLLGWMKNKPYTAMDNRMSLFLFIVTHTQFLIGIILYFVSYANDKRVQFNSETMSNPGLRYFTVEHVFAMIVAIALITAGRVTSKKLSDGRARHKRMFIFNTIALLIIVLTVYVAGRPYNTL